MQLELVSVSGFRSIETLRDLQVGSPTLLTGHNDAGKSALLDAIRFLLNAYSPNERDATYKGSLGTDGATERVPSTIVTGTFSLAPAEQAELGLAASANIRRMVLWPGSPTYEIEAAIPDDEQLRDLESLTAPVLKERVSRLGLTATGTNKLELLEALRDAASIAPSTSGWVPLSSGMLKALPSLLEFNPSGVADAEQSIRAALQTSYKTHESHMDVRGTIRDLEQKLEDQVAADADDLRDHIMSSFPDIGEVTIIPSVSFTSGLKNTQVNVTNAAGEAINLGEAGAGRARRVSLAVWEFNTGLLSAAGDVVILYDEPDTHLDYSHQRNFMKLIGRQTDMSHVRMVIATHSMNLIDGVDISDVVLFKHNASLRTEAHILADTTEVGAHLGDIAASLGLRNTVLLHERLFVGVEGATEAAVFPVLFRLSTGRQLEACGIAMWSCDNNEGALKFAGFLNSHGRDVVFIVDQDSKKNSAHLFNTKKLAEYGLTEAENGIYLGNPNELEDLFHDEIWVRVANNSWRHVDGRDWEVADIAALRSGKFSSGLLELMKTSSETGPPNKQTLVTTLALQLTTEEVPQTLRDAFALLIDRAA